MKSKKTTPIVFLLLSTLMILSLSSLVKQMEVKSYKGNDPVIIFDIAHQQFFNNTHLQSALQLIEEQFDAEIHVNNENFTLTNLRGADLLILPAPYIDASRSSFGDIEKKAITEFYQDGGSILYLANPYFFEEEMRNFSSNLRYINDMMGISEGGAETYGSISFNTGDLVLLDDFNSLYNDERFIYINESTLLTTNPIIQGIPEEDNPVKEILIHSNHIVRSNSPGVMFIVNTSRTTYELNSDGEVPFGGGTSIYTILAADEILAKKSRAISCASAIMFSDLQIVENDSITWFEAFDNAKLWKNMIAWLLRDLPKAEQIELIPDFGLFAIILIAIFFVFMVIGSVLYVVGREIKRAEVSETIIKMRDRDDQRKKVDKDIEAAYYAEDVVEKEEKVVVEEEKEVDMKRITEEIKKKPPKARSRSERRRKQQ